MPDPSSDPVADLLKRSPTTPSQRAEAWDAFQASTTADDLASKLQALKIPQSVKADLWDLKEGVQRSVTQRPVSPDEPTTYLGGAWKGFKEGVAGGATGYAKEFVPGVVKGVAGIIPGAVQLVTHPVETVEQTLEAVGRLPQAMQQSAVNPEQWGRDVADVTGQVEAALATPTLARGVAKGTAATTRAVKPVLRAVATPETAARIVKHGSTAAGSAVLGPTGAIIGSQIGEELANAIRARSAASSPATGSQPVPTVEPPSVPTRAPVTPKSFNPEVAFRDARHSFDALKEAPLRGELANAMEFMRRGFTADEAVAKVIAKRLPLPPNAAAELARRLGTPGESEVAEAVLTRNKTGTWQK
jgi:hypothetical protein